MTQNGSFHAVWDQEAGRWSTDIYDVQRIVDQALFRYRDEQTDQSRYIVDSLSSHGTRIWDGFMRYLRNSGANYHELDDELTFSEDKTTKFDYRSKRLDYTPKHGAVEAWDELVGTLYSPEERRKIEWAIGAIVSGASTRIQKFLVFYGPPGSGKSTILNVVQLLFDGYIAVFDAKELVGGNNSFSTAAFKSNPLVAVQHDGDLSRIADNTRLNALVAHETIIINEKYRAAREARSRAFIMLGTNQPVKITDAKSGILRRLIDVVPTGETIENHRYFELMERLKFELPAIAAHCQDVFESLGENFYSRYRPREMMLKTDIFYNFVEAYMDVMKSPEGITLKRAYALYREYCEETGISFTLPQYKFREELRDYFVDFRERGVVDGVAVRSLYVGFKSLAPKLPESDVPLKPESTTIELSHSTHSLLDDLYAGMPAQYANEAGIPEHRWANATTRLADLDTSKLHYVKIPENHIVVDFDLTDSNGDKSLERCLEAASKWPTTYAEVSRSGRGLHLHYIYQGDKAELATNYSPGIEVKTLLGDSALRRVSSRNNNVTVASISSGLPKKRKAMLSNPTINSEKALRELIARNLRKEIHPGTKPSVDFIKHILDEAYESGLSYDVSDMRRDVLTFAARSTNQSLASLSAVNSMRFVGQTEMDDHSGPDETPIVFFDVEVYPNLFLVCWKIAGSDQVVRMINPEPSEIEDLFKYRLVGFNNRRYDNHILYARFLGYTLEELYRLSVKIVTSGSLDVLFGPAYGLSYADVYDFAATKMGLKKWEIELGITHSELEFPWDQPVAESDWEAVGDYCANDVNATEAVFNHLSGDWAARLLLSDLSGLSPNRTTKAHTAQIIFGGDKTPNKSFVYTDLSTQFDGYTFEMGNSQYRGEDPGEGGYVYAEPGYYTDVTVLDVASMHPASIVALNLFGQYTGRFEELMLARLAIKHGRVDEARELLGGRLAPYLDGDLGTLAYALKIVINSVYGLTSAKYENVFKDPRNVDNIVAKRGALFMINLKHECQSRGATVAHIKTDSIKIPNATPELIDFIVKYGESWGYVFEIESVYDKLCLVNDAVYVGVHDGVWDTVGAQFQHPYVKKTIFTGEEIVFDDLVEARSVTKGAIYMTNGDDRIFVGRTGAFVAVPDGYELIRVSDDKEYAITGTKGHLWVTRDVAKMRSDEDSLIVDNEYYDGKVTAAREAIERFVELDELLRRDDE